MNFTSSIFARHQQSDSAPAEITHIYIININIIIIIIIIIISCHRFSFFPGTSALEPLVNPTTQASSLSL
jgi:hypothetical protein